MNFEPETFLKEIDYQYGKLDMVEMEKYLVNIISKISEKYGEDSTGFASLLNELGGFYRGISKYQKAEEIFLKAKEIIRRVVGENNPNYATTINNLAGVYRLTGNFSKAERLFLNAIEIYKNTSFGESYPYSSALNNLGLLYMEMKEYEKAVHLFEEANVIAKKVNKDPVLYATGLGNLASAYIGLGQIKAAEKLLIEAVDVYSENNEEGNSHFGSAINSLGQFYFSIGDFAKAEKYFIQALEQRERDYGLNNHEFAKASDNLSVLYEKMGRFELAEKYAKQARDAYFNIFGEGHSSYKTSIDALKRIQKKRDVGVNNINNNKKVSGMELALMCFAQFAVTTLCRKFPNYSERIAAGLVGEGSECYGFDDEISQDHDWGPSFCLWLTKSDFESIGAELQSEYEKLSKDFLGLQIKLENKYSTGRRGVFEIGSFYKKYIGLERPPETLKEWQSIPEINFSVVTNGKLFMDPLGDFSRFRSELKAFYPEDIRLKKISARCAIMAQAGQYNYSRSIKRSEYVAAEQALASFIDATISVTFLLNKEYKPYYKWMHKALKTLPILGGELYNKIFELTVEKSISVEATFDSRIDLIEEISQMIIKELTNQGMSQSASDFLLDHAYEVQGKIIDLDIRTMHVMAE